MINPIDKQLYLSEAEFRARLFQSKAWAAHRQQPRARDFDESAALAEIENRNSIRRNGQLPIGDSMKEVARRRLLHDAQMFSDRVRHLANASILEIYGPITPGDFSSMSSMKAFFASKQNLVSDLIMKYD
jgi:hypothetical protein